VMEIFVPPLRERREDILPLASRFVAEFTGAKARFSPAIIRCLDQYRWPGNVRELRNAMERATLLSHGEVILPEHLPLRLREAASSASEDTPEPATRLEAVERQTILQTLRELGYNRSETARALGISRRALLYKLQRFREQGCDIGPSAPNCE
jgi:DNA-binding NtrC family response regulator